MKISAILFTCLAVSSLGLSLPLRAESRPLKVVTLNTVLTEIAREVGGKEVQVTGLLQPGVDPHTFDPSPADMRAVVEADVVFASGLSLETYLDRLVANVGVEGKIVAVGDALPHVISLSDDGHGHNEKDPHWWHGIDNVIFVTDYVCAEFARRRPEVQAEFRRNAAAYRQRLVALKSWAAQEVAKLPPGRRQLITSHDAFGYLARDYGFTVHALNGLSTESEADARHVAGLIGLIRREKIGAVFAEASVNSRVIENLIDETGARLGGTLYADGLGAAGTDASTYESMYRHNVRTIVEALLPR